jgi:hypothetical protein
MKCQHHQAACHSIICQGITSSLSASSPQVNQSLLRAAWGKNSTAEHVPQSDSQLVQQVVTPTLDLYWGSVNMSAHANRSDAPVGGAAHYVCDARYR